MQAVYELMLMAAASDTNIILYGESGTGKEPVARAIHNMSARRDKPFVPVNCGAIPENLLEREFFGHRKGAFTGAERNAQGYLGKADGGGLFLDEIGEIKQDLQVKLLRAIEGGGYSPIGSNQPAYIRKSMHVPPRCEAVLDLMPAFFTLLKDEQEPAVRVVLGHFFFVYPPLC